jgi:ElaB/YqjD/DUF883 family membrane-anchored ribosome-binding protein
MSETKDKIKEGIDEAATKAKNAAERVGETTGSIAAKAHDAASHAKEVGATAIHEGERLAKNAADAVMDRYADFKSGACAVAEQATESAKDGYRLLAERAHRGIDEAGALIRANPGAVLTVALGLGVGVGLMLMHTPPPKRHWWSGSR